MNRTLHALLLLSLPLAAQEPERTVPLSAVVVTASKHAESPGNVSQKIGLITDSALAALVLPNGSLAEAVGTQPGAAVRTLSRNDANWGTSGGIGPKYSTYMLQGLPVDAFIDPMTVDIAAVSRLEVQRGPASVLYPNYLSQDFAGGQSPLAGMVNIILKERIDARRTAVTTSLGSYRTLNGAVFHQDAGVQGGYFAGASYERSDYTDYGTPGSWLNMKKDPQYVKARLFGGATLAVDERQSASLFVNRMEHSGDAGRVYRGFDHGYTLVNAGYTALLSGAVTLRSGIGFRSYDRSWQESAFGVIDTLTSNNGVRQVIVPADIAVTVRHAGASLLTVGADHQQASYETWSDPLTGVPLFGNRSTAWMSGVYAQEELRIGGLTLRAGARWNTMHLSIDLIDGGAPGEPSKRWDSFLWSGGVRYDAADFLSLYANAGSSFIPPGLKSTGGTIRMADKGVAGKNGQLPNPDLKPESGIGIDAGADLRLLPSLTLGMRGFMTTVDDAIIENVVSANPSQTQSINAGESKASGVELEVRHDLKEGFVWFANYTYTSTSVSNSINPDLDGTEVPFSPEHIVNAGADILLITGTRIVPQLSYSSAIYDGNSKSGRASFTPGTVVNLSVTHPLAVTAGAATNLFITVVNLTDNRYEMPWQFRNTGTAVTGGVRVQF